LYTQSVNPNKGKEEYKREYPLYGTTRLKKTTLARIQRYGSYGMSIDEIVTVLLDRLEGKEILEDQRSW
jgi:hypothetical protein